MRIIGEPHDLAPGWRETCGDHGLAMHGHTKGMELTAIDVVEPL